MTPTETLMKCLEQFGECEAASIVVVYTDESDCLFVETSCNKNSQMIGLLELAKRVIYKNLDKEW